MEKRIPALWSRSFYGNNLLPNLRRAYLKPIKVLKIRVWRAHRKLAHGVSFDQKKLPG